MRTEDLAVWRLVVDRLAQSSRSSYHALTHATASILEWRHISTEHWKLPQELIQSDHPGTWVALAGSSPESFMCFQFQCPKALFLGEAFPFGCNVSFYLHSSYVHTIPIPSSSYGSYIPQSCLVLGAVSGHLYYWYFRTWNGMWNSLSGCAKTILFNRWTKKTTKTI